MKFKRFARWVGGVLLALGLLAGGSNSAIAQTAPVAPKEPVGTLYDQTDNAGSNSADSTDWGSQFRTLNSQAADDFIVPVNAIWHITSATASGAYIGSVDSGNLSLLVQFYANFAGLPCALLLSQTIPNGSISGLDTGVFVVSLSPALTLGPGHYWFSAQASVACTVSNCKHWVWTERSVQFQVASVWENPPGGSVPSCLTWEPRVDVCNVPDSSTGKDLLFKLDGTSTPVVASVMLPIISR